MPHYEIHFMLKQDPHGRILVQIVKFAETVNEVISWIEEKYPNAKIFRIEEVH
jgi:hypothetical protein